MLAFVIVLQVLVALFLIMVVLLQPGNRGGASAALGGAGSDTVFGARGANTFLSKITFGAAVCFMVTNFALSYMSSSDGERSVLEKLEETSAPSKAPAEQKAKDAAPSDKVDKEEKPQEDVAPVDEVQPEAAPQQQPTE